MHVGFLVPLVMGVVSGYFSKKCQNEFAYLIGAIAAISYLVSLIIAPLSIHVIILAVVCIITNKLLWINTCKLNQSESDISDITEITEGLEARPIQTSTNLAQTHLFKYRGAAFSPQSNSKQEQNYTKAIGKYRGSSLPINH